MLKDHINNLPNKITLIRILVIPIILILYPLNFFAINILCAVIFMVASLTDMLDGYYARKLKMTTKFGALVDPVADKLLVCSGLVLIAYSQSVPAWVVALLLCRDFYISGLRLIAASHHFSVDVNLFGKFKTTATLVAIFCLMINTTLYGLDFKAGGIYALSIATIMSVYSAYVYSLEFWEMFTNQDTNLLSLE